LHTPSLALNKRSGFGHSHRRSRRGIGAIVHDCFSVASAERLSKYGSSQMGKTIQSPGLDWLAACDVEGRRSRGVSGQNKILKDIRPVIICEDTGEASKKMTDIFVAEGYALYDGERPLNCWNTGGTV
jgi:hypothetical protein